jgi:hypothetical protein
MKMIDGDAAVWLLRKHNMYDAAELIKTMPAHHKKTNLSLAVSNFLSSKADKREIDTSAYMLPKSCYQTYRQYLLRRGITDCYCYMEHGRVYLARVQRRGGDGETAVRRP